MNDELNFDRAEDGDGAAGAQAARAISCASCQQTIPEYFTVNGTIFCGPCRAGIEMSMTGGSGAKRFAKAAAAGLCVAILGSILWYGITRATGYELGLIAIVVGFGVGRTVHWGSDRRGGRLYQALAVILTYCSITTSYVPDVYAGLDSAMQEEESSQAFPAAGDEAAISGQAPNPAAPVSRGSLEVGALLTLSFLFALAAPFLAGFENILGILIIGFALYEAARMNQKYLLRFEGPFRAGGTRA